MQRCAPAKVNLCLHVTGRRADGYHLLDSVVAFAGNAHDILEVTTADTLTLTVDGDAPTHNNLILKAARALQADGTASLRLAKRLPIGGGIGGGSADAAAALHLLNEHWRLGRSGESLQEIGLTLGADVPVCIYGKAARMQGIGEVITPLALPPLHAVLANPGVMVSTAEMYRTGLPVTEASTPMEGNDFLPWLKTRHNAFQALAIERAPVIGKAVEALAALPECELARMSGSGSTCFGLFPTRNAAASAAKILKNQHPEWWVAESRMI